MQQAKLCLRSTKLRSATQRSSISPGTKYQFWPGNGSLMRQYITRDPQDLARANASLLISQYAQQNNQVTKHSTVSLLKAFQAQTHEGFIAAQHGLRFYTEIKPYIADLHLSAAQNCSCEICWIYGVLTFQFNGPPRSKCEQPQLSVFYELRA